MSDLVLATDTRKAIEIYKKTLSYGHLLSDNAALALYRFSQLHDLSPEAGEAYFLVREKDGKIEERGVYPGIKGKRKHAKRQMKELDPQGTYRVTYKELNPKVLGFGEEECKGIAVTVEAELRDSVSEGQYLINYIKLKHEGLTDEQIAAMIGPVPVIRGYGVVKKYELKFIKMTPLDLAKKRGESSCLSQRFDLPFGDSAEDVAPDIVYVDAEVTDVPSGGYLPPVSVIESPTSETKKEKPPMGGQYTRPYPPDVFISVFSHHVDDGDQKPAGEHDSRVVASVLDGIFDGETEARHILTMWMVNKSSTKNMTNGEIRAFKTWLGVETFGDAPDPRAISEARSALVEARKAAGQQVIADGQQAFL